MSTGDVVSSYPVPIISAEVMYAFPASMAALQLDPESDEGAYELFANYGLPRRRRIRFDTRVLFFHMYSMCAFSYPRCSSAQHVTSTFCHFSFTGVKMKSPSIYPHSRSATPLLAGQAKLLLFLVPGCRYDPDGRKCCELYDLLLDFITNRVITLPVLCAELPGLSPLPGSSGAGVDADDAPLPKPASAEEKAKVTWKMTIHVEWF